MIMEEVRAGRVAGPFSNPPLPHFVVSPLGIRKKKDPGKFRLIHDLSYPKLSNDSVNANIPTEYSKVKYQLLDHVVSLVQKQKGVCYMSKTDVASAFRQLPINPSSYHLLGFTFKGNYFYDRSLAMGCSASCFLFEKLSWALVWIMQNKLAADDISHILDDFIFIHKSHAICESMLNNFIELCDIIGLPIKHSKTVQPATTIEAHGVLVDSVKQEVRLPEDKLQECKQMLITFSQLKKCRLQDLQVLLGKLNFACKAIRPGRTFLRRLYNLASGNLKPHHHIRITAEARADIAMWLVFIKQYNGTSMFINQTWLTSDTIRLYSDAAGAHGYAVVYGAQWAAGSFPTSWDQYGICLKELYPIALAMCLWGHNWANRKVMFLTDNMSCAFILNTLTSKETNTMKLVRHMVLKAMKHNVLFKGEHIPGRHNVVADLLSRSKFQRARQLATWLEELPVTIPAQLLPENILQLDPQL